MPDPFFHPIQRWAILLACCLFFEKTQAQPAFQLQLHLLDSDTAFLQQLDYQTSFTDSTLLIGELKSILDQLFTKGYLAASFDSLKIARPVAHAWLHTGEIYRWLRLRSGNAEPAFLDAAGFRPKLFQKKIFSLAEVEKLKERLLAQAENNGYPFASVRLDSIHISSAGSEERQIEAVVFLEKGRFVAFDSLNTEGDVKISRNYLRSYLGWRPGEPFNRQKVLRFRDRLRELPFLKEKSNALITFYEGKASVRLFLEKKKASRFDFLIGVLPDSRRVNGGKVLITGNFLAEMQNPFGLGERIYASFERLRPQTQRLDLAFAYPYVLDLPFGVDLKFNLYRRDSTYSDVSGDFGVQYLLEGGNYLKAFWNSTASNLLAVDTTAIKQGQFPPNLDVKNDAFGLELNWQRLDYRFNPRRGWAALLRGSAGNRQIRRNQSILNVAESFYDTLPSKTFRFVFEANVERYFPLAQRSTVKLAARGGAIFSEKPVYQNEQYRIGGNRRLRGFDEESIFATRFAVFTLEYRLLIGLNSYFYFFGDYGYVEDRRAGQPDHFDRPLGVGGGLTFETGAGVFGLGLAVGRRQGEQLDFRNPKIHFGYVNYF